MPSIQTTFDRPSRRDPTAAFYRDLRALDPTATLDAFGHIIVRVDAPRLSPAQLAAAITAAKAAYRDLDWGD